jgi:peroxin-11B
MSKALVSDSELLAKFIKFTELTNGRDKIARLLQYGSRFFAWYLQSSNLETSKKLATMEAHCSLARKLFRLFRTIEFFQKAQKGLEVAYHKIALTASRKKIWSSK